MMETFTMWKSTTLGKQIYPVQVVKQTKDYVTYPNGKREAKTNSGYQWIRETKEEAQQELLRHYVEKVTDAEQVLEYWREELEKTHAIISKS